MGLRILTQRWEGSEGTMLYPPMVEGMTSCYMLMLSKHRAVLEAGSIEKETNWPTKGKKASSFKHWEDPCQPVTSPPVDVLRRGSGCLCLSRECEGDTVGAKMGCVLMNHRHWQYS